MPTEIMCPDCGGVIFAAGTDADANRACTCGKNVDAATVIAATSGTPAVKMCVNCGADVTQAKRLKDKEGNYSIYTGTVTIAGAFPRMNNDGDLEVWVTVNACTIPVDDKPGKCLLASSRSAISPTSRTAISGRNSISTFRRSRRAR